MRRRAWMATVVLLALLGGAVAGSGIATAQPTPTPGGDDAEGGPVVGEAVPGDEVCALNDYRLVELSGMEAVDDGFIVINDSQDSEDRRPVFFLNGACEVADQIIFPTLPRDPEGLALDRDSDTLWVGDIGDNFAGGLGGETARETVALWRIDLAGPDRTPVIHRFVYPDGQPRDAEALILDGDGSPIIVTKEVGSAELFRPTDLIPNNPAEQAVPLESMGEFTPVDTGTEHDLFPPAVAQRVVTGGANSPDGDRVVLRTYTDAYEFDVVDGDVIAAITTGEPRITPLPGEPQGEAITYSVDGEHFLTVSEVPAEEQTFTPVILRYTPTEPPPPPPPAEEDPGAETGSSGGRSIFSLDSPQRIINLIAVIGVLGLIMVGAGVFGIVRARRQAPDGEPTTDGADDAGPSAFAAAGVAAAAGGASGTVYGGGARPPQPPVESQAGWEPDPERGESAGVYRAGGEYGGQEYGGHEYAGNEYGGHEYAGNEYGGHEYAGNEYGGHEYAGNEYGGQEYGGHEYAGNEYAGNEYGGQEYGGDYEGGAGYPDPRYGQYASAEEGANYQAAAYGYPPEGYPDQGGYEPGYPGGQGDQQPRPGQGYAEDGAYRGGQDVDDYYDDPDYPYEFREPGPARY